MPRRRQYNNLLRPTKRRSSREANSRDAPHPVITLAAQFQLFIEHERLGRCWVLNRASHETNSAQYGIDNYARRCGERDEASETYRARGIDILRKFDDNHRTEPWRRYGRRRRQFEMRRFWSIFFTAEYRFEISLSNLRIIALLQNARRAIFILNCSSFITDKKAQIYMTSIIAMHEINFAMTALSFRY